MSEKYGRNWKYDDMHDNKWMQRDGLKAAHDPPRYTESNN